MLTKGVNCNRIFSVSKVFVAPYPRTVSPEVDYALLTAPSTSYQHSQAIVSISHIFTINLSFPYFSFHSTKSFVPMDIFSTVTLYSVHNLLSIVPLIYCSNTMKMYFIGSCFHTRITHDKEASQVIKTKEIHKKVYFQKNLCLKIGPIAFP